ncbi:MAG: type II toxin-antitoxin system HicA family toxin [Phycisphaeraceae bacterium]|nr:MAG: type II toxin-antitoxin system HicA family toxin [Phycisphaeraceae bacterium]
MAQLPVISGKQTVAALERAGYSVRKQRGSHVSLVNPGPPRRLIVVPLHKELAPGTLRAIIRQADLTVEQFCELLDR